MKMNERAEHINNLIALKDFCNNNGVFTLASNIEQSLDYAISSLKTDLKYDLMYEGEDIYTKADMVTMLTEIKDKVNNIIPTIYNCVSANFLEGIRAYDKLIQQKINSLKESENE